MVANVPEVLADLLEIASYVYSADCTVSRGGARDTGESWRRSLHFFIPVRRPEVWSKLAVLEALTETISFLSDDDFEFTFSKLVRPPPAHLYFEEFVPDFEVDDVILFSGGIDSFAGAMQEALIEDRRVALVSHRLSPKKEPWLQELVDELVRRAPRGSVHHVPVWANKGEALRREPTQRSRSFLLAALGAMVAVMLGRSRIRFYEDGVMSLNAPLAEQVVGARAARSTHPRALLGFARILSEVLERPFGVENPFLWKTKADVVRLIEDSGCGEMIARTRSCSRTAESMTAETHCGRCAHCVNRRFATLAAKLPEGHDPQETYRIDLLTGPRVVGEARAIAELFVQRAMLINSMPEVEFLMRYAELTRALRHLGLSANEAAARLLELHRRHGAEVSSVLDEGIRRNATALREGLLPDSCLIVLAATERYVRRASREAPSAPTFRRDGQMWTVHFGTETVYLKDSVGLHHLAQLLAEPGRAWTPLELLGVRGGDAPLNEARGEITDRESLAEYKEYLAGLEAEIREAEDGNDLTRAGELRLKREAVLAHLKSVTGLGHRPRLESSMESKAQNAVLKAINRSLGEIRRQHPELDAHLRNHLKRGAICRYAPEPLVHWVTS